MTVVLAMFPALLAAAALIGPVLMALHSNPAYPAWSRTPGGSTDAGEQDPQLPPAQWAGVEQPPVPAAPPAPQTLVGVDIPLATPTTPLDSPPSPQTLAGTAGSPQPVRACQADLPVGGAMIPAAPPTGFHQGDSRG